MWKPARSTGGRFKPFKSDGIISLKPEIKELMLNVVIVCAHQGGCQEGKSGLVECVREVTGAYWDRHVGKTQVMRCCSVGI